MSSSPSDSTSGQKGQNQRKWLLWGLTGLIAGAIGGVALYIPSMYILDWIDSMVVFGVPPPLILGCLCFTFLAHLGISFLTGVAGGFLFSRLRPKWGNLGAIIGGLIIEVLLVAVIAYEKVPYLFLPKFEDAGMGGLWVPGQPLEHHFVVGSDFSEEDALKVGNFYQRRHNVIPLDIGFYCLEGYDRRVFSSEYMLYEYSKDDKDSPPSISTPANPSKPGQGTACK